jgi:hypothetical protein
VRPVAGRVAGDSDAQADPIRCRIRNMPRLLVVCLCACSLLGAASATAQKVAFHAAAEAGPELDTNAYRVNELASGSTCSVTPPIPDCLVLAPLFRISGSAGLRARLGRRHVLAFDYGGGGKVFFTSDAREADELVQLASGGWGVAFAQRGSLWLSGSYYDAFQRTSTRDFRTGTAGAQVAIDGLPAGLRATFDLGYRGLAYKPLLEYGFHGLAAGAGLGWRGTSGPEVAPNDWEVRAGYTASLRFFDGDVIAAPERCSSFPCNEVGTPRRDLHQQLRFEATYLGTASAGLFYSLELNRSNSYGETFTRHALGLRFTAPLVWGLFLTAKASLLLSRYQDPFLISQVSTVSFVSIDEENRSSLVTQIAKELSERWSLILRWSLYVNASPLSQTESSTPPNLNSASTAVAPTGFLRQTLFLGARFEYGR